MSNRVNKVLNDVVKIHTQVRALALAVQTDPDLDPAMLGNEFYYAVLESLEGKTLDNLTLRLIDRERVRRYLKEG